MAFPNRLSVTQSESGTRASSHNVSRPAYNVGDLLVMILLFRSVATPSAPGSFTEPSPDGNHVNGGAETQVYSWEATDSQASAGSITVSFTTDTTEFMAQVIRYEAGTHEGVVFATPAGGTSNSPNPPNLNPGLGALDFEWVAAYGVNDNDEGTAAPTNYTGLTQGDLNAGFDFGLGSAFRQLNADSEDPSNFTISASDAWAAFTIAIQPASGGATPVEVALTPATMPMAAQALTVVRAATAIPLTPASMALSAQALVPTVAPLAIPLTPATLSLSPQALTPVLGATAIELTPAVMQVIAQALSVDASQPVVVELTPASLALSAQTLQVNLGVVIPLTPATMALSAEQLQVLVTGGVTLTPAVMALQAQVLVLELGAIEVELQPATVAIEADPLNIILDTLGVPARLRRGSMRIRRSRRPWVRPPSWR